MVLLLVFTGFVGVGNQVEEIKTGEIKIVEAIDSSNDLLAYWKFDECEGDIAHDSSGNGYHGIIHGATWTGSYPDCGLVFDGVDDYIDLDNHSENLGFDRNDFYVIDVYVESSSSSTGIIYGLSHTNNDILFCDLEMNSDGEFIFRVGTIESTINATSSSGYNDGEYHHIEAKYFGEFEPTIEIWIDDNKEDSITEWQSPFNAEDFKTAKIACKSSEETEYFNGVIDEVKIYKFDYEPPFPPPSISGPLSGKVGTEYNYTFVQNNPECDDISYFIDWGDNTTTGWTEYYLAGVGCTRNHTWLEERKYTIRAKVKDVFGEESDWGYLEVTMPKNYKPLWWLYGLLERFPLLQWLLGWFYIL